MSDTDPYPWRRDTSPDTVARVPTTGFVTLLCDCPRVTAVTVALRWLRTDESTRQRLQSHREPIAPAVWEQELAADSVSIDPHTQVSVAVVMSPRYRCGTLFVFRENTLVWMTEEIYTHYQTVEEQRTSYKCDFCHTEYDDNEKVTPFTEDTHICAPCVVETATDRGAVETATFRDDTVLVMGEQSVALEVTNETVSVDKCERCDDDFKGVHYSVGNVIIGAGVLPLLLLSYPIMYVVADDLSYEQVVLTNTYTTVALGAALWTFVAFMTVSLL